MRRAWQNHSLTIVLAGLALLLMAPCIPLEAGEAWDTFMTLGGGCGTVALLNLLSGPLREKNRPDA